MLATQTADGDLRVWSVAKPPTVEQPRVIRVLKRPEPNFLPGRTWITWSRNGRIIQFSEDETWSWDVRTKHVTYDVLPVLPGVRGMAGYGAGATLFSLGPDFTVQQYDVEQSRIVANIRHVPGNIPPTPPEDNRQLGWTTSGSEEDGYSPVAQSKKPALDRSRIISPQTYNSGTTSMHSKPPRYSSRQDLTSPGQNSEMTGTTFSVGAQPSYVYDYSKSPGSARANRKASKLRQEVVMSPQDRPIDDLFPFTRARLNDVPFQEPRQLNDDEMTPDNLRRQMLQTVFGWTEDIRDLIRDEMSRHAADSQHAIFLSRWLHEDDEYLPEIMGNTSVLSSMDWMLLTLGTIDHSATTKRITQVFIEKMLSRGDIHAAATVLLALGDRPDAIEVYVSRNQFLEAVLLTCLITPSDWQRQSHLVRKWGEHVVGNSQQQFAMRCFSCTDAEVVGPWTSPTMSTLHHPNINALANQGMILHPVQSLDDVASYNPEPKIAPIEEPGGFPEVFKRTLERRRGLDAPTPIAMPAPPTPFRTAAVQNTRMTPQTSALKLITSFGTPKVPEYKFPGLKSADFTPTAGTNVTPIAESAIDRSALSPGGTGNYRQNNIRSLNAAMSARGGVTNHKHRLPSIGETPVDVEGPSFKRSPPPPLPNNQLPTPADSSSDRERRTEGDKDSEKQHSQDDTDRSDNQVLEVLTPARYDPNAKHKEKNTPQTAVRPRAEMGFPQSLNRPDSRHSELEELSMDQQRRRTGSRQRKPDGLSINLAPTIREQTRSDQNSGTQPRTGQTYSTTQFETNSEMTSPMNTEDSAMDGRGKTINNFGRSIDQYISSVEQAQYYSKNSRSRDTSSSKMTESRNRGLVRRGSETNEERTINPAKRSPSSPVPMSPEDLRMYSQSVDSLNSPYTSSLSGLDRSGTPASRSRLGRHQAHTTSEVTNRQRSHSARAKVGRDEVSPERSRSTTRKDGAAPRSPSSPLPMLPAEEDRQRSTASPLRFVSADRQHRSREGSAQRERFNEPRKHRHRSRSRQAEDADGHVSRRSSTSARAGKRLRKHEAHPHPQEPQHRENGGVYDSLTGESSTNLSMDPEARPPSKVNSEGKSRRRTHAKDLAAAELEARRLSLARRPSAPNIPLPGQTVHGKSASESHAPPLYRAYTDDGAANGHIESRIRRPSTPRAMTVNPSTLSQEGNAALETLPSSTYHPPPRLSSKASPRPGTSHSGRGHARTASQGQEDLRTALEIEAALTQLPRHPAYSTTVARSRETSRTRDTLQNQGEVSSTGMRATSRDRTRGSPALHNLGATMIDSNGAPPPPFSGPMVLPELQHLVTPPMPPPPPAPPKDRPQLSVRTNSALENATRIPLPASANPRTADEFYHARPSSANPALQNNGGSTHGHRRGRSGNSESQLMGKIKNLAGKMRTPSQNRDNAAKSPPQQWQHSAFDADSNERVSPYETNVGFNQIPGQGRNGVGQATEQI